MQLAFLQARRTLSPPSCQFIWRAKSLVVPIPGAPTNYPGLQDPPAVVLVSNVIRGLALLRTRCQDVSHVLMPQVVRLSTPVCVCAVTGPKDPELGACGIRARTA